MGQRADVMQKQYVNMVAPEPLQTVLKRAHHGVIAIIEMRMKRQRFGPSVGCRIVRQTRFQQPSDLGGNDDIIRAAQDISEPSLRQAKAVKRRGIKILNAAFKRCTDSGQSGSIVDGVKQSADRRAAKTQLWKINCHGSPLS